MEAPVSRRSCLRSWGGVRWDQHCQQSTCILHKPLLQAAFCLGCGDGAPDGKGREAKDNPWEEGRRGAGKASPEEERVLSRYTRNGTAGKEGGGQWSRDAYSPRWMRLNLISSIHRTALAAGHARTQPVDSDRVSVARQCVRWGTSRRGRKGRRG